VSKVPNEGVAQTQVAVWPRPEGERSGLLISDCGFQIEDCQIGFPIRNPQSEISNPERSQGELVLAHPIIGNSLTSTRS
jgi:hypothetical protein